VILRILKEFDTDETFEVDKGSIVIGRDDECNIVILDDLVSRNHARVVFDNDSYWLEDLNSTNGSYLNGMPIDRTPLKSGDKINIGKATLIVQDVRGSLEVEKPSVQIVDTDTTKAGDIYTLSSKEAALFLSPAEKADLATLRKENETLRKLFKLNKIMASTRNVRVLIDKILDLSFEMLNADNICILLVNEKTGDLDPRSIRSKDAKPSVTVSRTIVNHVLEKGHSVLTSDAMDDNRFDPRKSIITAHIKSVVCTPINSGKIVGVFYADRRSSNAKFSEDDLKIVTILSNMIGIAMENDFWHREAIRKERLSAIGEVITGLSHYAKNILNGLKLAIQALEVSLVMKAQEKTQKSFNAIKAQEKRISNLVLNMLDYSKERVPIRQKVALKEVVEDIADPYADYFVEKNITFESDIPDDFPEVSIDITGIHRILLNLFTNALDAIKSREKGRISITACLSEDKKSFTMTMEDNGVGVDQKLLERIFDVFYSTKNFEGTGLGLAVVKKIIEEHGGNVSVTSQKDKGSKFFLTLPVG